jgi:ADP-ribosylglycohydrolase
LDRAIGSLVGLADGDADTVAAVTGQLAGAIYGESGIPAEWLERLWWRDGIRARAVKLFDLGARGTA